MRPGALAGHRYRVGMFQFDADSLELRKHGRRLRIRPQSLKLLKLLLAASGQPVPRDAIQAELWGPDVFVDVEQGINHCVKELRRAFGDDASTPRYIETLPRLGYRFVAPFERIGDDEPSETLTPAQLRDDVEAALPPRWQHWPSWRGITAAVGVLGFVIVAATWTRQASTRTLTSSRPVAAVPSSSAAQEAYNEGRYHLARFSGPDTLLAVRAFERALASDATSAQSHAGLATASAQMYIRFGAEADLATWKARAVDHATRALHLDDRVAEAHEALAAVARYTEVDWGEVIRQSVEALRLNPALDLPHYYIASALQHVGRLDLVEEQVAAGLEANPLNLAEAYRLRGVAALWDGRFDEARFQLEQVSRLTARSVADAHLAAAIYYGGDAATAEALLRTLKGSAQAEQRAAALLASLLAARGDRAGARSLIETVRARTYRDHHVAYSLGAAFAGLGDAGEAVAWLRESARTGFLCHGWYEQDPLLGPLRRGPELAQLIAEMKGTSDRIAALLGTGAATGR
jgi:DNA-binding winged helix-turn-helix (wHTH) protein